ncbi:MAG: ABC transporter permease [Gemmatimonadaceae bacterium]
METLLQDFRYALRGLRRSPGFTVVAVLTLALGIGVNSAIFGVVNAILYRPLPVERPDELINVYGHQATADEHSTVSFPNLIDYERQATTLSGVIGYSNFMAHATIDRVTTMVIGEIVTDRYFDILGVRPVLGRTFTKEENDGARGLPVAVLSYRMWQQRFNGDRGVLGKQLRMNGKLYTVVGVAPERFGGMMPAVTAQLWIPVAMAEQVSVAGSNRTTGPQVGATTFERRGHHWLWMRGRLKPGVSVAQARSELDAISARLATQYPDADAQERLRIVPSADVRINPDADSMVRPVGLVLVGAVTLVLIVACGNLANLMLARAARRRKELSLRVALGASRVRVLRQLLTESIVVALGGGFVAVPLAAWISMLAVRMRLPLPLDIGLSLAPDWRVLAFTGVTAIATGLLIGLLPALRASNPALAPALRDGATWMGGGGGGRRSIEMRDGLVVLQVAVSLVLVVAGALLVRSVKAAGDVPLGFDGDRLAQIAIVPEMNGYDAVRGEQLVATARQRLLALPQVEGVAVASRLPMSINNNTFAVFIDGRQSSGSDKPFAIDGAYVDEGYLSTLGLRVLAGRAIEEADRRERRRVAVINKTMADRYWPGLAAAGREFRLEWGGKPYQIIGVVADYKVNTPGEAATPYLHLPSGPDDGMANFIVRTRGDAAPQVAALVREFQAIDPELAFFDKGTLRDVANVRLFPVRAGAVIIGAFGALALVVAAIGLYGVIGYSVSRRIKEIGIRKALGAETREVVMMVMKQGMTLVAIGGAIGLGLSALASRALSAVLFVGAFDPVSFGLAFLVLALVAAVANGVPAWRASRVDALVALKAE